MNRCVSYWTTNAESWVFCGFATLGLLPFRLKLADNQEQIKVPKRKLPKYAIK
jgi:hypothetical protein